MKKILYFIFTKSIGLYINTLSFVFPKNASQLAYSLFSEPREGRLSKNKLPEILSKAHSETFQVKEESFQTYTWQSKHDPFSSRMGKQRIALGNTIALFTKIRKYNNCY